MTLMRTKRTKTTYLYNKHKIALLRFCGRKKREKRNYELHRLQQQYIAMQKLS